MKTEFNTFICRDHYRDTKREKPFKIVKCRFFYNSDESDRKIIDDLLAKGISLAREVNPKAANDAGRSRTYSRIVNNCAAGLIAEYLWRRYLNRTEKMVVETTYSQAKTQIDLEIISNKRKIEVRSSFPYANLAYVLCHGEKEFDVIGSYANSYKAGEIEKDFYVRTLFRLAKLGDGSRESFIEKIKQDGYEAYLTGGATWEMMLNDEIAVNKDFIPEDSISFDKISERTGYRVVPFSKALDTMEIREVISASAKGK